MEKIKIKHQSLEDLFRETFPDVIKMFGPDKIYFGGMKMYIKMDKVIISVQFTSTNNMDKVFDQITLTALNQYGPLDINSAPFVILMKETKAPSGSFKNVNLKMISNATGEYTATWTDEITDTDRMALNDVVIKYVELFSSLQPQF